MRNALGRFILATAALVLAPGNSTAQETVPPPTPQEVLERLDESGIISPADAVAILTQLHKRRTRSELDAFADALAALAIAGDEDGPGATTALFALIESATTVQPGAVPYAGAYDALHKIFRGTKSSSVLRHMIDVDPRRGKEVVRVLLARRGDDACTADYALRDARDGDEIAQELGIELGDISAHYCLVKYHGYRQTFTAPLPTGTEILSMPPHHDVLAQLQEGDAEGTELAIAILTGMARLNNPALYDLFADSLLEMAVADEGASAVAGRVLAVLVRSADPVHADAEPYANAYLYVDLVFQATESQAALESLVEIDPARAQALLTDLAQRDQAVACKARAVLAETMDGPRLLRDLEGRGALTYRCDGP